MATYLEELHELFPNGLQSTLPSKAQDDCRLEEAVLSKSLNTAYTLFLNTANLLIPLFDDFEVEDKKVSACNSPMLLPNVRMFTSILGVTFPVQSHPTGI